MNSLKLTFFTFLILSYLPAKTPFVYTIGFTGGYDNNVMRFSEDEFNIAASNAQQMGGATTFDSFVYKLGVSGKKSVWDSEKKSFTLSGNMNWADYKHHPEKQYGAGGLDATFKWGSYQSVKYSVRHLNSFYLRHYVDRDISTRQLAPCAFTDRNQSVTLTQNVIGSMWTNIGVGYLQRYYENPFNEFDLDIIYIRGKINKKIKKLGSASFQVERGSASSQSHFLPDRPSSFNRSYETMEWYLPIKIKKGLPLLNELGLSLRQENRIYAAEDPNDPLHAGRNHLDSKIDLWIKKKMSESLNITLTGRYRQRETESSYNWVTDLKSFNQLQFWCKMEWDLVYDRY